MAINKGRSRGTGRSSSFGKRQQADDDFRKKKKDGPKRGTGGSSYGGGKRSFSAGPRGEKKSFGRDDKPRGEGGERKSFGRPERKSSSDRPERRSFGGGERRSSSDRPERKSYGSGERKSYGSGERKSFDRGDKKPFGRKRFDDKPSDKPFNKPFKRRDSEDKPFKRRASGDKPFEDKPFKKKPFEKKSFVESKVDSHRERVEKPEKTDREPAADGLIRLNKFISNSGVCSRREADELIKLGVITVNGVTISEMGYKVKPTDDVRHEGKKLTAEKPVYILLNKPKGFITTTDDPQERNTVMQLIAGACKERVYPVGRLDRNTTGLLLLTNDGELTDKLTHPSFNAKKIYKVELDRPLTKNDFQTILDGVKLEEGKALVDDLAIVSDDGLTVGIELHIGWNHVVRRIFDALEYSVVKLDRVVYAGLDKKDLKRGQWRFLKTDEIVRLKHFK